MAEHSSNNFVGSSPSFFALPVSGSTSPSSSSQEGREQEEQQQPEEQQPEQPQLQPQPEPQPSISYRVNISISDAATVQMRDEAWSCLVVLITFWFFASMTLILGFYGSVNLQLGPNCSRLLQASSFFVQDIKVKATAQPRPGPILYGFSKPPSLDIQTAWSETHNVIIPVNLHKEWVYFLNEGSQINVSYSVKSEGSSPLTLIISQGREGLIEWVEDQSYPNTTLSWNIIHGDGLIQQKILKSSDYYIGVGNLNPQVIEVQLNFSILAFLYNATGAYYKCSLNRNLCGLKLFIFGANAAVLTTPAPEQGRDNDEWYIKLSYGPRWITYFVGSGLITVIILLAFKIFGKLQSSIGDGSGFQAGEIPNERIPLLTPKDDDSSSWGSSCDSVSHEEDLDDCFEVASREAKLLREDESNSNPRRFCAICFDAQRDCFFLPCGHCATCFTCGTRIAEEAGTCPICRRRMKKVRKIFTV